jgi:hypothetical protein
MKRLTNTLRGAGIAISLSALIVLGGCDSKAAEPNMQNFTKTIDDYLAERGHFCLAEYTWPIYVADEDATTTKSRDAIQMPVLEQLGLVRSTATTVQRKDSDGNEISAPGKQYELTAEGQKYYLHKPIVVATATRTVTHDADLCVATLTLDKVVGWETPVKEADGTLKSSVLYTYHIDPAPFTRDPRFQQAFPMVTRVVEGAGVLQLREGVRLTKKGWVAEEFFQR